MNIRKIGVVLLALLLAGMAIIPIASAAENLQKPADNTDVVSLFAPIDSEIQSTIISAEKAGKLDAADQNSTAYAEKLAKKYTRNMNVILDSLEKKTGRQLSASEREDLKLIIIQEHMGKASWEQKKKSMGVKEEDLTTVLVNLSSRQAEAGTSMLTSLPNALILSQVTADVYGGAGIDGGWRPYIVNGGNSLYSVTYSTGYPGKILYECHFYDEDVPSSYAADAAYDAFRLAYYGTIRDTQGFFIYPPDYQGNRHIEFGNDWDNGNSFGTVVGQHGYQYLKWNPGTLIYVSNVWNHAMGLTDRNSNMGKWNYFY